MQLEVITQEAFNALCVRKEKTKLEMAKRLIRLFETPDSVYKRFHFYYYTPYQHGGLVRNYLGPVAKIVRTDGNLHIHGPEMKVNVNSIYIVGVELLNERNKHFQTKYLPNDTTAIKGDTLNLSFTYSFTGNL